MFDPDGNRRRLVKEKLYRSDKRHSFNANSHSQEVFAVYSASGDWLVTPIEIHRQRCNVIRT